MRDLYLILITIIIFVFILYTFSLISTLMVERATNEKLEKRLQSFEMYYNEKYNTPFKYSNTTIEGLAFGDFIAVWTKNKTITEVLEICMHEYAHNNLDMGHNSEIRDLKKKVQMLEVKNE